MCHESSGIGAGRDHRHRQGFGHPSTDLEQRRPDRDRRAEPGHQPPADAVGAREGKANGAKIIAINPLPEAGLLRFKNPAEACTACSAAGRRSPTTSCRSASAATWPCSRGWRSYFSTPTTAVRARVLDRDFIDATLRGLRRLRRAHPRLSISMTVLEATGLTVAQLVATAQALLAVLEAPIICWAMGLTQQSTLCATIQERRQSPAAARQ